MVKVDAQIRKRHPHVNLTYVFYTHIGLHSIYTCLPNSVYTCDFYTWLYFSFRLNPLTRIEVYRLLKKRIVAFIDNGNPRENDVFLSLLFYRTIQCYKFTWVKETSLCHVALHYAIYILTASSRNGLNICRNCIIFFQSYYPP